MSDVNIPSEKKKVGVGRPKLSPEEREERKKERKEYLKAYSLENKEKINQYRYRKYIRISNVHVTNLLKQAYTDGNLTTSDDGKIIICNNGNICSELLEYLKK